MIPLEPFKERLRLEDEFWGELTETVGSRERLAKKPAAATDSECIEEG